MFSKNILDNSPVWLIFTCALLLMFGGNYLGYKMGLWQKKKTPEAKDSSTGEIMGAIFGVLGFTLAFLFGMSLTRLEHKKEIVLAEAGAILSAYQQAKMLPEPYRNISAGMLKRYALLRLEIGSTAGSHRNIEKIEDGIRLSESMQDSLLSLGIKISSQPGTNATSFIQSISGLIDINMRRINNAVSDRIPKSLKVLMYVMALIGLTAIGYGSGLKGGRSLFPNLILVIVFATIIGIILDMDQPANSLFRINQWPMQDVLRRINTMQIIE